MEPRPRSCNHVCHTARRRKCHCFCGGVFHGKAGQDNRTAFIQELGPSTAFAALAAEESFMELAPEQWVRAVLVANGRAADAEEIFDEEN